MSSSSLTKDLYKHRADIQRRTAHPNESGSESYTWIKVAVGLPGRMETVSDRERIFLERESAISTHRFYCSPPSSVVIKRSDKLICVGTEYDIIGILPYDSYTILLLEVLD